MKRKVFFGILLIFVMLFLQGCNPKTMKSEDILEDLKSSSYAELTDESFEEMHGYLNNCDNDYQTECEIINVGQFENKQIYTCLITSSNSALQIKEQLKITYEKKNQWEFSDYSIASTEKKILSGISEEWYTEKTKAYFKEDAENKKYCFTPEVTINSVNQKLYETGTNSEITVNCTVKDGLLTRECVLKINSADGKVMYDLNCNQYTWDLQSVSGKKWTFKNFYAGNDNFVHIVSVDEENETMQVSYKDWFYVSTVGGSYEPTQCSFKMYEDCVQIKDESFKAYIYPDTSIVMSGEKVYPEGFVANSETSVIMDVDGSLKDQDGNIILTKEQVEKQLNEAQ